MIEREEKEKRIDRERKRERIGEREYIREREDKGKEREEIGGDRGREWEIWGKRGDSRRGDRKRDKGGSKRNKGEAE